MTDTYPVAPSRSIVVGHDGSEHAKHAVSHAARLAKTFGAPLVVVRAWELDRRTPAYTKMLAEASSFPELTSAVRDSLSRDCEPIVRDHPDVSVTCESALGPPAEVLTAVSAEARVLVLGSRGREGIAGLLLGSVANRCLHQTSIPILIVHPSSAPPSDGRGGTEQPVEHSGNGNEGVTGIDPGSVVVGHDGSEGGDRAVAAAFEYASALHAPLAVVRFWTFEHIPQGALWGDGYVRSRDEVSTIVGERLMSDVEPTAARHPDVATSYRGLWGDPRESLVRASADAAMLVVGTRGRGGFRNLLLGSVSAHCAHRAVCPTLIVPRAG